MEFEIANELAERAAGPVSLRLVLQPVLAIVLAAKDGMKDARVNASPYLRALLLQRGERRGRITQAWTSAGTVFVMAVILDGVYQYLSAGTIDPVEALLIALILCALPYSIVRGPVSRIMRSNKAD